MAYNNLRNSAELLFNRALEEKNTALTRLDSYRNFGLVALTFAFATYIGTLAQPIDPFWRFVLLTVTFIIVTHFFNLETINTIYVETYNYVLKETQDMLFINQFNLGRLQELTKRVANVHRTKTFWKFAEDRIRAPLFIFLIITGIAWISELVVDINYSNYCRYILVIVLFLVWWIYNVWNWKSYELFQYQEIPKEKPKETIDLLST